MNKATLTSVTTQFSDGDWIESKDQSSQGIRLIQTGNIGEGIYLNKESKSKFISDETFKKLRCTEIFPGDVLVSRLPDPIGRSCIIPDINQKMITAVDCTILRFDNTKCLPKYFVFFTKSNTYHFQIEQSTFGATRQRISRKNLEKITIPLPSIDEQRKIVEKLDKIQSAIDNKKQQLALLDEAVKSEFVEMFGEIKETVIIKDVCDVSGGYSFKSNDISDNEGVKILQIGNVAINDISWETTNYLPKSFIEKYNNFSLNENDIVMALTRPIIQSLGNVKTCMIRACDLPCLLNQRVGRIRPKDNTNIHYIFYCFMQHSFTSYIQACCKGSSQPNMSTKDIENFIIPKVPIELQNQFAAFVQQIDKSKFVVKQQIADLQELLDSKMQEYFS